MKVIRATQVTHGADWDQTTVTEIELDPVDVAISELMAIKDKRDRAQLAFEAQQERVIALMDERAEKSHISSLDGGWQATVVAGETVVYDDTAILAALPDPVRDLVTDRKINRLKLEQAVLQDRVPAKLVAEHATVKPRKPFVKLTEHRELEDED